MKFSTKISKVATSVALMASLALAGCSANTTNASSTSTVSSSTSASATASASASESQTATTASAISYDTHYSEDDLNWDSSTEKTIDLSNPTATDGVTVENGVITITAAGNYRLTGTLEDGQVVVNAGDQDQVRLILDNASITNKDGAAIVGQSADELIVYTESGTTNTVTDGSEYAATGEDDPSAALFSKTDLTLAGEGTLKVTGNYSDGIASSDGLVIASGTYDVTAADDGIRGKDYVDILDGTITVDAKQDGIKSTNATDEERGWTRLTNGTVTITAGDDGFKSEKELEIAGGKLTVESSVEGIEGQYITVSGGETSITSSDDGVNATVADTTSDTEDESTASTDSTATDTQAANTTDQQAGGGAPADMGQMPADMGQAPGGQMGGGMPGGGMDEVVDAYIHVTGGALTITAEGDGFDSNGTAELSGGTVTVNGPSQGGNGSTDVAGDFVLSGGTLLTGGTADMFVAPTGQAYVSTTDLASTVSTGDVLELQDSSGKTVATYTVSDKGAQLILFSTASMVSGDTYKIVKDGETLGEYTAQ